jgi:adenine-specific DNA-methyltransferase
MPRQKKTSATPKDTANYRHPEADLPARPEIGAQAHFKKVKPPAAYRFDSSLAPELCWDGQNTAREQGEALIRTILEAKNVEDAKAAAAQLKELSEPFLNWAGKAERLSFDVPTLPLFVHERLATKAILETLKEHKRDKQLGLFDTLFGSPEHDLADQVLRAYEHRDQWVNRMILGDSLVVMNSLLHYESLGGQVQMIYMDPPYGVKFGSNFQPFVRRRDVRHNDDGDITREPEMVQAYRDTWELGLHSYLTYLRDRLRLCRELLAPTGSIFVQISDENLHHVREVMDEVFGGNNFCAIIAFAKTTGFESNVISTAGDYILWYSKERERVKYHPLFIKAERDSGIGGYRWVQLADGSVRSLTAAELRGEAPIPETSRLYSPDNLIAQGAASGQQPFTFRGKTYQPPIGSHWKANYPDGMNRLAEAGRLHVSENTLRFVRFSDDFPWKDLHSLWNDTVTGQFTDAKIYVVQTNTKVIQRCLLMTTNPGDLVLDPTCGSGTTAYVAEHWGRRWITIDTSRVPLALARQRLLTASFDYYELADEKRGPGGGFVYKRRQNSKGEEVGGIVPHITLKSIANNEPPAEEVIVDRPEVQKGVVRVTGPFTVEASIAAAAGLEDVQQPPGTQSADHRTHVERMIEVLRRAPVLRIPGNQTVTLRQVRPPAKTLTLSAEALIGGANGGNGEPVAILFGPADGPLSERIVREAWDEAGLKRYARIFVIGFGIDPKAREFVEKAGQIGIPCVYLQATMDLQMGDLLKNMRSSQVFSVCGLPDVELRPARSGKTKDAKKDADDRWEVELIGLDTFDPATMEPTHLAGSDAPAWFLDTDYNGMVFRVRQAFFPRTGAWESLKKLLKAEFEDSIWDHLAGTVSAPFEAGEHRQIAVKVIDPRGNELIVVRKLEVKR